MCVIAVKFKGYEFPTRTEIQACMAHNRDGFAVAYNKDGKIVTFKTMDAAQMLSYYLDNVRTLDPTTTGMIFHARIATHGPKNIDNCHCWTGGGLAFAHNGMLTAIKPKGQMTDSETFFRDIFLPAYEALGWDYANTVSRAIIGTSKFAFLMADGEIRLMGMYSKVTNVNRKGVVYFSNTNHLWYYDPATDILKKMTGNRDTFQGAFSLHQTGNGPVTKVPSRVRAASSRKDRKPVCLKNVGLDNLPPLLFPGHA